MGRVGRNSGDKSARKEERRRERLISFSFAVSGLARSERISPPLLPPLSPFNRHRNIEGKRGGGSVLSTNGGGCEGRKRKNILFVLLFLLCGGAGLSYTFPFLHSPLPPSRSSSSSSTSLCSSSSLVFLPQLVIAFTSGGEGGRGRKISSRPRSLSPSWSPARRRVGLKEGAEILLQIPQGGQNENNTILGTGRKKCSFWES